MNGRFAGSLSVFLIALFVIAVFSLSATAYAEEIIYAGDGKKLQENPSWLYDESFSCLFPGTKNTPLSSGSEVVVNYNPKAEGVSDPQIVFGGIGETENVTDNRVELVNGRIDFDIYGGYSDYGSAAGNAVTVSGGSVRRFVCGGYSENGGSANNVIVLSGGAVTGQVAGGNSVSGDVTDNIVAVSDGSVEGIILGGASRGGDVTGNTVTISGGFAGKKLFGGYSESGIASGNTLAVSGGSVGEGGFGGCSSSGAAVNNMVVISGGEVKGFIVGGFCYDGDATDNTVTISGKPELAKAYLVGGHTENSEGDIFTGNALHLKSSGISVRIVKNFEYYNFFLPEDLTAGAVMLNVTDIVYLGETTVTIFMEGKSKLQEGDKIALIHTDWGFSLLPKNKSCQVKQGGLLYEFSIYADFYNLWAEVTKISNAAK